MSHIGNCSGCAVCRCLNVETLDRDKEIQLIKKQYQMLSIDQSKYTSS